MPLTSSPMKKRDLKNTPPARSVLFKTNDTYTPPEEDVQTWGIDKMLQCWERRDKKCFWENFMWLIDGKRDRDALIIDFNTDWQPDLQDDPGSKTRCITSDQPYVKWWSTIGKEGLIVIPNPFNRNPRPVSCGEIVSAGYQLKMVQACREKCNRLANGSETCQGRDNENMGFEQVGCDGKTVYCWCNSDQSYKK